MLSDPKRLKRMIQLLELAIEEDLGRGDATEDLMNSVDGHWQLNAREDGVFCGQGIAKELFKLADLKIEIIDHLQDGDCFHKDSVLQEYKGSSSILTVERILLNSIQQLTAISTETAHWVKQLSGSNCELFDTRKTTPAWRILEKFAVLAGGGRNHRMALDDSIMIKDNHHARKGDLHGDDLTQWIANIVAKAKVPVIVEVEDLEDCLAVARAEAQVILLDNMALEDMEQCVKQISQLDIKTKPQLEASGGITWDRLPSIANTGVDRISVGAITQNPPRVDLALDVL